MIRESALHIDRLAGQVLDAVRGISERASARVHLEAEAAVWNMPGAARTQVSRQRQVPEP